MAERCRSLLGKWEPGRDPWYFGGRFILFILWVPIVGIVIALMLTMFRIAYMRLVLGGETDMEAGREEASYRREELWRILIPGVCLLGVLLAVTLRIRSCGREETEREESSVPWPSLSEIDSQGNDDGETVQTSVDSESHIPKESGAAGNETETKAGWEGREQFWEDSYGSFAYGPDDFRAAEQLSGRAIAGKGGWIAGLDPFFLGDERFSVCTEAANLLENSFYYIKMDCGIQSGGPYRKSAFDGEMSDYVYYGELDENACADGSGVLLKRVFNGGLGEFFAIQYMGEFEKGEFSGYGILFSLSDSYACIEYEGYFRNGVPNGPGSAYLDAGAYETYFAPDETYFEAVTAYVAEVRNQCDREKILQYEKTKILLDFPVLRPVIAKRGWWENGTLQRDGHIYGIGGTVISGN